MPLDSFRFSLSVKFRAFILKWACWIKFCHLVRVTSRNMFCGWTPPSVSRELLLLYFLYHSESGEISPWIVFPTPSSMIIFPPEFTHQSGLWLLDIFAV